MRISKKNISRYVRGKANEIQRDLVEKWYETLNVPDTSGMNEAQRQKQLEEIRAQLPGYPARVWMLWKNLAGAAAAIALLFGTGYMLFLGSPNKTSDHILVENDDIAPGVIGATLTLANGVSIELDALLEGDIAEQAGVRVSKTADGELAYHIQGKVGEVGQVHTLSTAKGQIYTITLPDKSKVWLNASSSLTYNTLLNTDEQRKVFLQGEGYFEVSRHDKHPFVVQTDKQEIHVLGTHFNVSNYAEESFVETTLLEGSVEIVSGTKRQIIRPGEQAINNGRDIHVRKVDIGSAVDWKDGDFSFNHVDFKLAMQKITRWYNVEVIYDSSFQGNIETRGWISRKKNLSSVLKLIELSGLVHFEIRERKVYVYPSDSNAVK